MPSPPPEAAALARLLADAESDLAAVGEGRSLCRTGTDPGAGSAKHVEGRWSALREVTRRQRSTGADVGAVAADVLSAWEAAAEEPVASGGPWAAYRAGGIAALRTLLDELAEVAPSAP